MFRWSLTACRGCGANVVVPVAWAEHDDAHWWIRLRCGACGRFREVVVTDEQARRYDRALSRGVAEIARAVRQLDRERLVREAEMFELALERDLIDPADFAPRPESR